MTKFEQVYKDIIKENKSQSSKRKVIKEEITPEIREKVKQIVQNSITRYIPDIVAQATFWVQENSGETWDDEELKYSVEEFVEELFSCIAPKK